MSKATKIPNTPTPLPEGDATVFEKIELCAALWRQSLALDADALKALRLGNPSEAKELNARHDLTGREASALEWHIIRDTDADTGDGHAAKCRMVINSSFDPGDLVEIAWRLGHEAGRLGLSKDMPDLMVAAG